MLPITEQLATLYVKGYEAVYSESDFNSKGDTLEFTASSNGSNLNLFGKSGQATIDTSNYIVNINGVDTNQAINSLTFVADDKIIIKKKDDVKYFPYFYCYNKNYIKSIDAPLPLMSYNFTNDATDFSDCFRSCPNLISIPEDLFRYNTNITSFYGCFFACTNLISIPTNLFKYNTSATNFSGCFMMCHNLTSIPTDLFKYNTFANDFSYCFYDCSNIISALPELWVSYSSASHVQCFLNCTKASNYADAQAAGWA